MRNNLDVIKRLPNKFSLRDTALSLILEQTLLFSHIVPKEQLKSKEFGNRFKLRQARKLDSGSLVQRRYFDTKKLELVDCPSESILFEGDSVSEVLEIQAGWILIR